MTFSFWLGFGLWIIGIILYVITREISTVIVFMEGMATGLMLSAGLK